MYSVALFSCRNFKGFYGFALLSRNLCSKFNGDDVENGFARVEDFLIKPWKSSKNENNCEDSTSTSHDSVNSWGERCDSKGNFSARQGFVDEAKINAERIFEILIQDGPGFDAKTVLSDLGVRVSVLLVREVLFGIMKAIKPANKNRCARLGYKFFVWSGEQKNYMHTTDIYNLMMRIFTECEEYKAMWKLLDEMTLKEYPTTARTFNLLICACGEAGLARKVVERFVKSKTFYYRPFKHSFNAILHSLLTLNQYKLIEWVYGQMLVSGNDPDTLTYNIIMCAKFRLGKLDHFFSLLNEMGRRGFSPDFHTFNLLLHVLGKGDKPLEAMNLLNRMKEVGVVPTVLHFTSLIDGLSRAGNLEACQILFDQMTKYGCTPDVVCYTVMITGYVVSDRFDKAQEMFSEMIHKGQLPNVFTYNSMIRGLCMNKKYEEAWLMLQEMEKKGCRPNFVVYTTMVGYLRNAGRLAEAHRVIKYMMANGQYIRLLSKIKRYRRC